MDLPGMHLTSIYLYPVKSLRGCAVSRARVDVLGFEGDRRLMIVDETGKAITQREMPRMALIDTMIVDDRVVLAMGGKGSIEVNVNSDPAAQTRSVQIWRSSGLLAEDCGEDAAQWLGGILATRCRLVRVGARFHRPVGEGERNDSVAFVDAYPGLILGEASLADLNDRLCVRSEEPVTVTHFRPNLVFTGSGAYAEDGWIRSRIGDVVFRSCGPCARCSVTTIDVATGERRLEPLRTLANYRRNPVNSAEVVFGQNLMNETKSGMVRVGNPIIVLA